MAKSKKVLSLALAVVMAISMLSIGAFAEKTTPTATITVSATDATGNPITGPLQNGDAVTITVAAKADVDYFVGPTSVPVTYNADLFDVSNVTAADLFGAGTTEAVPNTDKAGEVTVVITPKTSGSPVATNLNSQNAVTLYTFTLTAKVDTGTCDVAVLDDPKTAEKPTGRLYMTSFDSSDPRTAELTKVGQTLILDNAKVTLTIGSAEPNTLLVKDTFSGKAGVVIDTEIIPVISADDWYPYLADAADANATGLVYGIDTIGYDDNFAAGTYPTLEEALTTTLGDEYLRVTLLDQAEGLASTGAKIEVLDADGVSVLETYYFVYFGDVNGNAYVDGVDASNVGTFDYTQDSLTTIASVIAADYNGDSYMDGTDFSALALVDYAQDGYASQADIAAQFRANALGY